MAKQKRGNDYLMTRLKNEHPTIFADWQAGKFESPRQALIAAGLKQPPKQINVLKNAWSKASAAEQAEFQRWIGASPPVSAAASVPVSGSPVAHSSSPASVSRKPKAVRTNTKVVDSDGYLQPWAKARVQQIMALRKMKTTGPIMKEMGLEKIDGSLGIALRPNRRTRISDEVANRLEQWIKANQHIK